MRIIAFFVFAMVAITNPALAQVDDALPDAHAGPADLTQDFLDICTTAMDEGHWAAARMAQERGWRSNQDDMLSLERAMTAAFGQTIMFEYVGDLDEGLPERYGPTNSAQLVISETNFPDARTRWCQVMAFDDALVTVAPALVDANPGWEGQLMRFDDRAAGRWSRWDEGDDMPLLIIAEVTPGQFMMLQMSHGVRVDRPGE